MEIAFHFQKKVSLKERLKLKNFLSKIFTEFHIAAASLNVIFCDDEYLLNINRSFLQHDYYTDIITFNLAPSVKSPVEGELYISVDRVKENARDNCISCSVELHRVIFHGVLHLCGLKDKSAGNIKEMRTAENKYLQRYFGN